MIAAYISNIILVIWGFAMFGNLSSNVSRGKNSTQRCMFWRPFQHPAHRFALTCLVWLQLVYIRSPLVSQLLAGAQLLRGAEQMVVHTFGRQDICNSECVCACDRCLCHFAALLKQLGRYSCYVCGSPGLSVDWL